MENTGKSWRKKGEPIIFFFSAVASILIGFGLLYDYLDEVATCDFSSSDENAGKTDGSFCIQTGSDVQPYFCCAQMSLSDVSTGLSIAVVVIGFIELTFVALWVLQKCRESKSNEV